MIMGLFSGMKKNTETRVRFAQKEWEFDGIWQNLTTLSLSAFDPSACHRSRPEGWRSSATSPAAWQALGALGGADIAVVNGVDQLFEGVTTL